MKLSNRELWILMHSVRTRMDWLARLDGQSKHVQSLADEAAKVHAKLVDEYLSRP